MTEQKMQSNSGGTINMLTAAHSEELHPIVRELGLFLYLNEYMSVGAFFKVITDESVGLIKGWIDQIPTDLDKYSGADLYDSFAIRNYYTLVSILAYAEGCTGKDFNSSMMRDAGDKLMLITILEYHARLSKETEQLNRQRYSLVE